MANLNHVEGIDKQPFPIPEQIEALTRELRDIRSEREQKLVAVLARSHICDEGGPVVSYIRQMFDEIFERYSLWYDFVDGSFLTCFVE